MGKSSINWGISRLPRLMLGVLWLAEGTLISLISCSKYWEIDPSQCVLQGINDFFDYDSSRTNRGIKPTEPL